MRRGIQLLLDNGTIKVSGNRDDYNGINVIEDCLAETVSDDEYASADEFFSSYEDVLSSNDSVMSKYSEEGVNVIVPCFGVPAPIEIEYHCRGMFLTNQTRSCHINTMRQSWRMV